VACSGRASREKLGRWASSGGDAWSGTGAVAGLGRRGNGSGRRAEEAEEEEEGEGVPGTDL
jgi:hypothetical protein